MKLMRQRIVDSILHRTGIDIRTFDNVIHSHISPVEPQMVVLWSLHTRKKLLEMLPN